MNKSDSKANKSRLLLEQLRHPIKLRLVLNLTILAAWYFLFYSPLSDEMALTRTRTSKEQKRITTAREVEVVRKSLVAYKDRVPVKSDLNELIHYVMGRIRSSPLKLVDLQPDKAKAIGPYDAIALRLTMEGTCQEIDELLAWVQKERRLLRVDSLSLAPSTKGMVKHQGKEPLKLNIQLTLTGLMERASS
jgi:Tfp pilus assembly protein PilO